MSNKRQGIDEGIEKILQDPKFAGKIILKDMLPIKTSTVILDFAKPLLDKIDCSNKKATETTIKKAIEIWNHIIAIDKACIKDGQAGNKMYRSAVAEAGRQNLSFRISRKAYFELLDRKEALYPDNNNFIIEHNVRWSDNDSMMHLAVVTGDANKV